MSDQVPDGLVHRMERTGQNVDALNVTAAPFFYLTSLTLKDSSKTKSLTSVSDR